MGEIKGEIFRGRTICLPLGCNVRAPNRDVCLLSSKGRGVRSVEVQRPPIGSVIGESVRGTAVAL